MENGNEISSSSLSFDSYLSNGSSNHNVPPPAPAPAPAPPLTCEGGSTPQLLSLSKLSSSLEKLVLDPEYDYTDAEIEVEGNVVGVHRCILAARSPFFHQHFKSTGEGSTGKPRFLMSELVPKGMVRQEAFVTVLNYLYTGKVQPSPSDVSTCVDVSCTHEVCGPAIHYAVEMLHAAATFQITELVMLVQRQLLNYVDKAFAEDVIPILVVAFHSDSKQLLSRCVHRIARSHLHIITIDKELPHEVAMMIKSLRDDCKQEDEPNSAQVDSMDEKGIRRIHRALDSDDIELVTLLMAESNISLDAAYALHYAAAYCTGKIIKELLNMGTADVNLKDSRGHTVLHVAARRKDSSVIVELLHRGASVSATTGDGRTAVTICRRLTRPKDFNTKVEHGEEAHKDRLCILMLATDRDMGRNPLTGTMSMSEMMAATDLHMRLLLLENRVAMARSLFPHEARLAMQIAEAEMTLEFAGLSASKGSYGNFREVDLNEIPSEQVRRLQQRLQALLKTVETGRRFFPKCSEVLDKLLEDDTLGALLLERGTLEEQKKKRARYMELKDEVMKAFSKDMAGNRLANISSSSSCSSSAKHKVRKR